MTVKPDKEEERQRCFKFFESLKSVTQLDCSQAGFQDDSKKNSPEPPATADGGGTDGQPFFSSICPPGRQTGADDNRSLMVCANR